MKENVSGCFFSEHSVDLDKVIAAKAFSVKSLFIYQI